MKNKIIVLTFLVYLTIPQLVSAIWWNPISWFEAKGLEIVQPINNKSQSEIELSTNDNTKDKSSATETKIVEKEIIKKIPVEKIVKKVITIPDQSIVNENNQLKTKIKELENEIAELKKDENLIEIKKKNLTAEIINIESAINKVLLFNIYCYQPLSSTKSSSIKSTSCESGLSEGMKNQKALELGDKKTSLLLEINEIGGMSNLDVTKSLDTQSIIQTTLEKEREATYQFFRKILITNVGNFSKDNIRILCEVPNKANGYYSPLFGILNSFDKACDEFRKL